VDFSPLALIVALQVIGIVLRGLLVGLGAPLLAGAV
jgi:uncharacterized protein YggT (Ycf19 family)